MVIEEAGKGKIIISSVDKASKRRNRNRCGVSYSTVFAKEYS